MGAVFRATDTLDGSACAVKVLHGQSEELVARFLREGVALAELRHPAIVRYVAHGTDATGRAYLAMEWLEGEDLADRLARGRLALAETLALATRVASALAVAHAHGIVHRDLKPSNLFLPGGSVAEVKLLDFGVARLRGAAAAMTASNVTIGTPGYMAPEQARGARDVDARADVFSLGCVLFECLTGRAAFVGEHMIALLAKILLEDAPRASSLHPVPEAIDDLVARMLAKEPAARPRDAGAVRDEVRAFQEGATLAASERAAPERAAITSGEQRLVSVVLASTAGLDPALAPTVLPSKDAEARAFVDAVAARFGARKEWLADGSVVLALTGSGVATDLAAHAARCALAVRAAVPDALVVLATGRAVLDASLPVGDVIEVAVRTLRAAARRRDAEAAPPIVLDATTAGLLPARFVVEPGAHGPELRGEGDLAFVARTVRGKQTPCVGREAERAVLEGALRQARDGEARAVLVTAPAGMGKSRLREELVRDVQQRGDDVQVWMALGDPMRAGAPLGMIREALRRAMGIRDDDAPDARRDALERRVAARVPTDAARVATFLGEIAGVPASREDVQLRAAREDPLLMGEQMRRAWLDFLAAECAATPVLLVLEDLHWGDLPSVKFVDAALRDLQESALLVLAIARPEVEEQFPKLWAGRNVTRLTPGELSPKAAARLVRAVLGPTADEAFVARLVARAQGNAFYLEELLRGVGETDELPPTVLAMVQARLGALSNPARRVLRAASVFGQTFRAAGVLALVGEDPAAALDELASREIVSARRDGSFADEHAFRHAITRDAAYATLTDEDRVLGHKLAAAWLEAAGDTPPAALADHFERGGDLPRAATWHARAAEQSLDRNDFGAAIASAERAVAAGADAVGHLRRLQADAHFWSGDFASAEAAGASALELLGPADADWYLAVAVVVAAGAKTAPARVVPLVERLCATEPPPERAISYVQAAAQCASQLLLVAGQRERADALLARIEAVRGEAALPPAVRARVALARAFRNLLAGDPARSRDFMNEAAESFDEAGDARTACAARGNAGYASAEVGAYDEAEALLRKAAADAARAGLPNTVGWATHNLGLVLARKGAFEEALALEQRAIDVGVAQGDRRLETGSRVMRARILSMAGRNAEALGAATEAAAGAAEGSTLRVLALAALSRALQDASRSSEALTVASEAMAAFRALGELEDGEAFVRLVHAEALRSCNDPAWRDAARTARDALLARAAKIADPSLRASFLERVDENARTLALAASA